MAAIKKNDATNVNVNELIFRSKKQYQPHNEEPGPFIKDIPSQEDRMNDSTKLLIV